MVGYFYCDFQCIFVNLRLHFTFVDFIASIPSNLHILLIGNGFGKRFARDWIEKRRQFLQFWFSRIRLCSVTGGLSFTWPEIYGKY